MIRSMTGFGDARGTVQGWKVAVQCRSVNHRGLDVRAHLPRPWASLESDVLSLVKERVARGRVEIRLDVEPEDGSAHARRIDPEQFASIASGLRRLVRENDLETSVRVADILSFESVYQSRDVSEVDDKTAILAVIEEATDKLVASRSVEGARLHETMHELVDSIETELEFIENEIEPDLEAYRGRLEERMREALATFEIDEIDEDRILQEVAYYADKSDVSEELQRALSHIAELRRILDDGQVGEARGKKIDFYLQEMIREANTTGSKTGSAEITNAVIRMKSAVEKMREQAANIE